MAKKDAKKPNSRWGKEVREDPPQKVSREDRALIEKYYPNGGKYIGKKKKK